METLENQIRVQAMSLLLSGYSMIFYDCLSTPERKRVVVQKRKKGDYMIIQSYYDRYLNQDFFKILVVSTTPKPSTKSNAKNVTPKM
jgi:hypothetical protein